MAGTIKGIIVEIGGDTSGLQKALKNVNSATSSLTKELRGVNSLLKLDPSNTELLAQKQTILAQNIEETSEKLKILKETQQKADDAIKNGTQISDENYRNLQREIINTENKLKDLQVQASKWTTAGKTIEEYGNKIQTLGTKIDEVGNKLTTRLTLPLVALGIAGVQSAAKQEAAMQQVELIYGDAADEIKNFAENTAISFNMSTSDAYKYSQIYGNLIQSITDDEEENALYTQQLLKASSVIASATGRTMEDVMDRIRSGLLGNTEAIEDLGVNVNVSLLESTDAFKKFAGDKSWEQLDFQTQQQIRLFGILEQTTKKYGDEVNQNTSSDIQRLTAKFNNLTSKLSKKLLPIADKLIDKAEKFLDKLEDLDEEQLENIVNIGLMVAAAGPLVKIFGTVTKTVGGVTKGVGLFSQAIAVAANKATSSSSSVNNLARVISGLTSPAGIAITIIGALAAVIGTQLYLANKKTSESFKSFIDGMAEYNNGIQEAEGYLQRFNDTLFTSTKEQSELEEEMKSIQEGITEISKTASDERRDYTQEEIDQLDEYFTKLNDLQSKMMKIQESQGDTLVQTAEAESDSFEGNYQEYVARSQEWIKTAQEHYSQQKKLAEQYRIDSITNLNTLYNEEDRINNEQYNKELERINNEYNTRVTSASEQVKKITEVYSQGMTDRIKNEENMWPLLQEVKTKTEAIEQQHAENVANIKKWTIEDSALQNSLLQGEEMAHEQSLKNIYNEMDKNLSDSQQEQLQTWIQSLMNTEMYGGEIEEGNKDIAKAIITTWQGMPKDAKEDMEDTMEGMLEGMESKESTLYSKAASVADSIIGTLKSVFKIGSPSKVMRKMYNFVMQGMELGLEDEENKLYRQAGNIAKNVQQKLTYPTYSNSNLGKLNANVIDSTRTIFTTPTLNIYTQGEVNIRKIADEVNRIFGSQY